MKVNVYETVEVSDEQREQIAAVLDGVSNPAPPRRKATRDELKAYIWEQGSSWEERLSEHVQEHNDDESTQLANLI